MHGVQGAPQAAGEGTWRSLRSRPTALTAKWKAERDEAVRCAEVEEANWSNAQIELADAQRKGEYQKAGELAYGRIPELEKEAADDRS